MDETDDRVKSGASHAKSGVQPEPLAPWSLSARDRLFRLAYRLMWNWADAEDAVQDALLTAYERSTQLRDSEKWWPWVCRIVVQRCRLLGRRASLRKRHEQAFTDLVPTHDAARSSGSVELKTLVIELLDELPRRQREVLVLRHLQGMAFGEIAEVLALSPETARVHAQRGRERLAVLIAERRPQWMEGDA